jgi:hypothetical protein
VGRAKSWSNSSTLLANNVIFILLSRPAMSERSESNGAERNRTANPRVANAVLCQLSYSPRYGEGNVSGVYAAWQSVENNESLYSLFLRFIGHHCDDDDLRTRCRNDSRGRRSRSVHTHSQFHTRNRRRTAYKRCCCSRNHRYCDPGNSGFAD